MSRTKCAIVRDCVLAVEVVLAGVALARGAQAATITVDFRGGGNYTAIQPAIDAAGKGDTVLVKPGEYVIREPINFKGKTVTVKGEAGPDQTTIRMDEAPAIPDWASVVVFASKESSDSVLEGFTITGGKGTNWNPEWGEPQGGGVLCIGGSSPTITDCTIVNNSAFAPLGDSGSGGGICCAEGSAPTLTRCRISRNFTKNDGGGLFCNASSPILLNCTISGNALWYTGGGVSCFESSPTLTNCTIAGNSVRLGGGLYCMGNSVPILTSCIVWGNVGSIAVGDPRGAILCEVPPVVTYCCIEHDEVWPGEGNINQDPLFCGWGPRAEVWVNPSGGGPGDGSQASPFTEVTSATGRFSYGLSRASPCIGAGAGGCDIGTDTGSCDAPGEAALFLHLARGTYRAQDFELAHHVSVQGSGEDATIIEGTVNGLRTGATLSYVTVTKGTNGIRLNAESPEISHCRITGNRTGWTAGGIYIWNSSATISDCEIVGNSAFIGGGVLMDDKSSPTFANCLIGGNSAQISVGGVYCWDSRLSLTNCLIAGNHAVESCGGVGLIETSAVDIINCTIAGNSAAEGGGLTCCGASPTIANCILWGNEKGSLVVFEDCSEQPSLPAVSYCCVDGDGVWPGEGNVNGDPLFDAPGRWETCTGPEEEGCVPLTWDDSGWIPLTWGRWVEGDYYLERGSSCIDTGTSKGAPTADLEGNPRPCGAAVDMGAYESGGCRQPAGSFRRGDVDASGALSITDPILLLGHLFQGGAAPSCLDAADADDNGKVNITDAIYSLIHLFLGGPAPPKPFPECGAEAVQDGLDCKEHRACQ